MNDPGGGLEIPSALGVVTDLGTFFGRIRVDDTLFALFQPPAELSRCAPACWSASLARVRNAMSRCDGETNTAAMAKAGSLVAQHALDNGLYVPSIDESDLQYRLFKPNSAKNYCSASAGINQSAEVPLPAYSADYPAQTELLAYRDLGAEAFKPHLHWTSTQSSEDDFCALAQAFGAGRQTDENKHNEFPIRLIRRWKLS